MAQPFEFIFNYIYFQFFFQAFISTETIQLFNFSHNSILLLMILTMNTIFCMVIKNILTFISEEVFYPHLRVKTKKDFTTKVI